ncbi:MAG TPA: hypothetical protein VFU21_20595, partial [Kofleriaceae bacterium]|nr:hypothetical protein [Kofleriaceae bacterium]
MRLPWIACALGIATAAAIALPARSEPPPLAGPVDPEPLHTRMHAHFSALRDVHRALLFGDLKKAKRAARDLAEMAA